MKTKLKLSSAHISNLLSLLIVAALFGSAKKARAFTWSDGAMILGRPTADSVTVSIIPDIENISPSESVEVYIEYGADESVSTFSTATYVASDDPVVVTLSGLDPDTAYYYRAAYRTYSEDTESEDNWEYTPTHEFHTQRAEGETFVFTIQSDSHFNGTSETPDYALYARTLKMIEADAPDFHFDLGDTFMITSLAGVQPGDYTTAYQHYSAHREYFGIVGRAAPIFLVIGNHENEEGWNLDDTTDMRDSYPMMSRNAGKRYFLNPVPNNFYSGVHEKLEALDGDGLRDTVFSFQWGDALFVALDPYFYTMSQPFQKNFGQETGDEEVSEPWAWTLGIKQYLWLKQVLTQSTAKYKFVFSHQVTGGSVNSSIGGGTASGYGRGGATSAHLFEWGGMNPDGTWGFSDNRLKSEGWDTPIHQLMVATGVDIFFHGHDHIFAKEDLDGIVYQECPRPCSGEDDNNYDLTEADYDVESSDTLLNSGYLRVTVSPEQALVQYVHSKKDGVDVDGEISYEYAVYPVPSQTAPAAKDLTVETMEDQSVSFEYQGTDNEGDTVSYKTLAPPQHGVLFFEEDESVTYVPDQDFWGTDRIIYQATDGRMSGNIAYVSITVQGANDPPNVPDRAFETVEETPLEIELPDKDIDEETLSYTLKASPEHGTLTGSLSEGSTTYTPEKDYNGSDVFMLTVTDGHTPQIVTVTMTVTPDNDPPTLAPSSLVTDEDTPLVIEPFATDAEGDAVTFSPTNLPAHGTVESFGAYLVYTPEENFFGIDSFTCAGFDGTNFGPSAVITVNVKEADDAPVACGQSVQTDEDRPLAIQLVAEDVDNGGLVFELIESPKHGALIGQGAAYLYYPDENFFGADALTFKVISDNKESDRATVHINVRAVPDAPAAEDMVLKSAPGRAVTFLLAASDADSDSLASEVVRAPAKGSLWGEGLTYTYIPKDDFFGTDSFSYRVTDETDLSAEATVSIFIQPEPADTDTSTSDNETDDTPRDTEDTEDTEDTDKSDTGETDTDENSKAALSHGTYSIKTTKSCGCNLVGATKNDSAAPRSIIFLVLHMILL